MTDFPVNRIPPEQCCHGSLGLQPSPGLHCGFRLYEWPGSKWRPLLRQRALKGQHGAAVPSERTSQWFQRQHPLWISLKQRKFRRYSQYLQVSFIIGLPVGTSPKVEFSSTLKHGERWGRRGLEIPQNTLQHCSFYNCLYTFFIQVVWDCPLSDHSVAVVRSTLNKKNLIASPLVRIVSKMAAGLQSLHNFL